MIEITLRGDFYQIGVEHGKMFAEDIRSRVKELWDKSVNTRVLTVLEKTVSFLEARFPDIVQEIRGIAEGAGCSFESVFLHNNRTILEAAAREQCTHIAVFHDHAVAVGMNKDMRLPVTDRYFIKKVFPKNGLAFIGYGHVGRVWGYGMNEAGLCTAGTAGHPFKNHPSVPSVGLYLLSPILLSRCRTVDEALHAIMEIKSISDAGNLLLADAAGQIRVVEITPHQKVVREPKKGIIFTTNFFASGQIEHRDDPDYLQETHDRFRVIEKLCESEGNASLEFIQKVLTAHRTPGSVCRHQDGIFQTVLSWMADPVHRQFSICEGPPCQANFRKFSL
jgi:isopenicillin-N N-acyltransferase-like protein